MEYIKGKFKKIIFENSTGSGYTIGLFRVKEASEDLKERLVNHTITFTGYFYDLVLEETYEFKGEYIKNGKYGYQFQVTEYAHIIPEGKDAVVEFLSSSLVKGCGEKTANAIVNLFGKEALEKIKNDKFILMEVPKMSEKKMESIYASIIKYQNSDEVIIYLTKLGFSMKDAMKLLNSYGVSVKTIIQDNVYKLVDDIEFRTLDKVFFNLNEETDDNRKEACFIESMKELSFDKGDTYLYREDILNKIREFNIILSEEEFDTISTNLSNEKYIKILKDKYFLMGYYKMENYIANKIFDINNNEVVKIKGLETKILNYASLHNIEYNEMQIKAIKSALTENITIITGGPGTGKTTIITAISSLYIDLNTRGEKYAMESLVLLAPTGRAAKRMSDLTGLPASTIHRYLKWDKTTNKFEFNEYNKRNEKFIIVDESSMIDTELMYALLRGIKDDVKLIIVGDDNQLPSVGPGLILTDLITSDLFNHISLSEIYRQTSGSSIPYLCLSVKNHELTEETISRKEDFSFIRCDNSSIKDTIKQICILSKNKGISEDNLQILAPMYKGMNGIDNLNILLQDFFNPSDGSSELKLANATYRKGDKVLQLVNDPDNNIYNGDIGYIKNVDLKSKDAVLTIDFYGNAVFYKREDLMNIKHAYAITVHKSQGSEFDHVIMPVTMNYGRMLYNKLIYTGLSRAKKSLILIGNPNAFYTGVNNDYSLNRKTNLTNILMNKIK